MEQFRKIEEGMFLGPQPTAQDLREARQAGIRTVIDFRMPGETPTSNEALAAGSALDYVNIPVNKQNLSQSQIDELDRVMQEKPGPFLVHCASGARAAMLIALRHARKHHWSARRTFDEARAMGVDLESFREFAAFVNEVTSH